MKVFDSLKKIVIPKWRKRKSLYSHVVQKQWVDSSFLTDSVYDELDERHGLAHKLLNKLSNDRFDKWFDTVCDNDDFKNRLTFLNSKKGLDIRVMFKRARRFALKHGYCIVFLGYKDQSEALEDPSIRPISIDYLRIIKKRWIKKIELDTDEDSETYGDILYYHLDASFFEGQYQEIKVHASRCIHVINGDTDDPEGISMFKPMYNWLNMFDDTAWSVGQAYFRYASGFPVLKIDGWEQLSDTQKEDLQKQWKNVCSMTGWIAGKGDEIEFKGAQGRALNPKEFFEVGLMLIAVSGDLPYALIAGVNAGAVTGSETNLKDYYSDVSSKQTLEEEPLLEEMYGKLIDTNQLPQADYELEWLPLFEQNEKEIAETEKIDAETIKIYEEAGIRTEETQEKLDEGELIEIEKLSKPEQSPNQVPPNQALPNPTLPNQAPPNQEGEDARRIKIKRTRQLKSKFADGKYLKLENKYFKGLDKVFKIIERSVIQVIKGYYSDSKDALEGENYKRVITSISSVFKINEAQFSPIVNSNLEYAFGEGIKSAEGELKLALTVPKMQVREKLGVVQGEHLEVVKTVSADIKKEISVQMGIVTLNPVEKFSIIEKLIKDSFAGKKGRLKMGVGNELNSALNQGNVLGYEASGIVVGKEWVAFVDGKTTDTCLILNGEVVPIGEAFSSGDYAPPAADPPHPCRSSLRSITASEAGTLGLNY